MQQTVLYDYWRSSAAYRLRIGLNLLGLPYHAVAVNLVAGEQSGPDNTARNPQGLVPTLEIDGQRFTQSLAILEYLQETRAPGWLPADAAGRARVRALSYAIAMEIHPVCNLRVARYAEALGGTTMQGWMTHFLTLGLQGFEALLQQSPPSQFCHGDTVSLADLCLVPQTYNARRWGIDLTLYPRTAAISATCEALPAFAAAHPDRVKPPA